MNSTDYYDWDDINVGRYDLNHSERFFERKHLKHEKLNSGIPDLILMMEGKENNANQLNTNCETNKESENKRKSGQKTPAEKSVKRAPPNLMLQPFNTQQKPQHANAPSVYRYAEVYEKKKQAMIQRQIEEERKNRIFHSKPAPKFSNFHQQKKKSNSVEVLKTMVTAPTTPLVLKKSKEMEEKRRQKIEEYQKRNRPQKFISREAHVLREEPFVPKKLEHVVELQPFNLHMEKRLEERKQFDEHFKKSLEEKKKQEEEERKRRDEELSRELRKMTSFKARPNPFK